MCGLLGFEFESVSASGKRNQGFWRVSWSGQRKARIRPGVDALSGVRSRVRRILPAATPLWT